MRVAGDDLVSSRNLVQEEKVLGVACESGLDLTHNVTYYSTLVVHNAAMETQSVTVTSDRSKLQTSGIRSLKLQYEVLI